MKRIKKVIGRIFRSVVNEAVNSKVDEILNAGTKANKDLNTAITELDTFGGLMSRKEFIKKLKHTIVLIEKRREWIDSSIYNKKGLPTVESLVELEKDVTELYHKARREDDTTEISKSEGRLEIIDHIKETLEGGN